MYFLKNIGLMMHRALYIVHYLLLVERPFFRNILMFSNPFFQELCRERKKPKT